VKRIFLFLFRCSVVVASSFVCFHSVQADEPNREGDWIVQRDEQLGIMVYTLEMVISPKAEARPALKHSLIPDDFDLRDGNAAIFYLKAMGFLEQNNARDLLSDALKKMRKLGEEKGDDANDVPPYSWLEMPLKQLPLEEVKQYLQLTSFQPRDLAEAARRRSFSLDRNVRQDPNPVGVLLPEIQIMRELARNQSLRCRVAIAEGRVEDALAILGQQYAMAKHLGTDEFLVSNLVGAAVATIAYRDALQLLQHPTTPNLYWAFASLPYPIVDLRKSLAYERQFLFEQVKVLREVDDDPRNAGYWQDFIDRMLPQIDGLDFMLEGRLPKDAEGSRAVVVATIAAGYPGAKRYLLEEMGMNRDKVDSYTTAQTFFLAVKRFYEQTRDNQVKWNNVPFAQASVNSQYKSLDEGMRADSQRIGWCSVPTTTFLASFSAVRTAQSRTQQTITMLQTVEAIRMHGAQSGGKLPDSLQSLSIPVPADPFTGKPLLYELSGDKAIITGHRMPGIQYRIVLRFAS